MRVLILGAGLVGAPMAADLARESRYEVCVADIDETRLGGLSERHSFRTVREDLSKPDKVQELAGEFDLVIDALPGSIGYRALEAVIEAGTNIVDIAFFPEDPFALDELAHKRGVVAVVDCGVSPGMSNLLVGHAAEQLDETDDVLVLVGGLPEKREWPYEYKAVFSPADVIEEYVRPARCIEGGRLVVKPPLSDLEILQFEGIGELEAFNSDGLRTLLRTIEARNMREKTLRYPGHVEKIAVLEATGFFCKEEIEIGGARIRPLDVTAKILFPKWKLEKGDVDFTIMRVVVEGKEGGKRLRCTFDLFDRYDESTGTHSMARTTGYTATVAARMIMEGLYDEKGISPPEFMGRRPRCVEFMLDGLRERGVVYRVRKEVLE